MNSPHARAGAVGMGVAGGDPRILTTLESRGRTWGQFWRRREESATWAEGSELRREGGEGERERKGRRRRTRFPWVDGRCATPKPSKLTRST